MNGLLLASSLLAVLCFSPSLSAAQDYIKECVAACLAAQQNSELMRLGTGLDGFVAPSDGPTVAPEDTAVQDSHDPPLIPSNSDIPITGPGSSPSDFPQSESAPGESSTSPQSIPVQVSIEISAHVDDGTSSLAAPPAPGSEKASASDPVPTSPVKQDANSDPNLCSNHAVDGMATVLNGSVIVFRGHFFWLLNPKTRKAGPARSISEDLGVPSPIDAAFTRCNCQGKIYIIKGDQYWILDNGVMEAGHPRSVSQDFGGLNGTITAALSVPATRKKPEMIFFFKKGGTVQKLSFPPGSGPNCSGKRSKNTAKNSKNGKQDIQLSGEINIKLKMKGFPISVRSALTIPNPRKSDGFDHYVFSGPKALNVKISGDLPALTAPASHSSQQNNISKWLQCA